VTGPSKENGPMKQEVKSRLSVNPEYFKKEDLLDSLAVSHYMSKSREEFYHRICYSRFFEKYYEPEGAVGKEDATKPADAADADDAMSNPSHPIWTAKTVSVDSATRTERDLAALKEAADKDIAYKLSKARQEAGTSASNAQTASGGGGTARAETGEKYADAEPTQ